MTAIETTGAGRPATQMLVLQLADEIVAVEARHVREIIEPVAVTRVPGAPAHLAAVMNVRGTVVPVADLRVRVGLAARPETVDSRIVVMELDIDGITVVAGIMADRVHAVATFDERDIQPPPRLGLGWEPQTVSFVANWNGQFIVVPKLEALLNAA